MKYDYDDELKKIIIKIKSYDATEYVFAFIKAICYIIYLVYLD